MDKLVLNECPGWWNVETADGCSIYSATDKRLARICKRWLQRNPEAKNGEVWNVMRGVWVRAQFYVIGTVGAHA